MLAWQVNTNLAATIATSVSVRYARSKVVGTTVTVSVLPAKNWAEHIPTIASAQCAKKRVVSTTVTVSAGYVRCVGKN
jgi:hypothetical protein